MTWYVVFYNKNGYVTWYASSMDPKEAKAWVKELQEKGYSATIDTVDAPSE